ncbi:hypothetical protein CP8484711_1683, partial [Chlamydia psittaci 84-8471/1]
KSVETMIHHHQQKVGDNLLN